MLCWCPALYAPETGCKFDPTLSNRRTTSFILLPDSFILIGSFGSEVPSCASSPAMATLHSLFRQDLFCPKDRRFRQSPASTALKCKINCSAFYSPNMSVWSRPMLWLAIHPWTNRLVVLYGFIFILVTVPPPKEVTSGSTVHQNCGTIVVPSTTQVPILRISFALFLVPGPLSFLYVDEQTYPSKLFCFGLIFSRACSN